MKFNPNIGMLLLAAFLVLTGLCLTLGLTFTGFSTIIGLIAIAAGGMIALNKATI
jgi:hypothetical protein